MFLTACSPGANTPQDKDTLVFADAGWDSIRVHNDIAAYIIEEGYGYKTDVIMGSTPITVKGLIQGDIDLYMEVWTDNVKELYEEGIASGDIVELAINFDDNAQGLYVPTYMIEGDPERGIEPMASNLKSVKDLPEYREVFQDPDDPEKGRVYGSPPSWAADEVLRTKFETYDLYSDYNYFNPGSDTALTTSLVSAYKKGEPWVGYSWEPTWVMGKYDMTLLQDEPYDEEKWEDGFACEFPGVDVTVAVNKDVAEGAPEVVDFLKNYVTSSELTNKMLAYMQDEDADSRETAVWFLKEYQDLWTAWVPEDIAQKVLSTL